MRCWQDILERFPTSLEAAVQMGQCLFELGEFSDARTVFASIAQTFPDKVAPWRGLAAVATQELHWRLGDLLWHKCFSLGGRAQDLLIGYVDYLIAKNDFVGALALYQSDLKKFQTLDADLTLIKIYQASDEIDKVLRAIDRLQQTYQSDDRRLRNLKADAFAKLHRFDDAIDAMESKMDVSKAAPPAVARLAQFYMQSGHLDQAVKLIDQVPEDWHAHRTVANTLSWRHAYGGDFEAAKRIWNGVEFRPNIQNRKTISVPVEQLNWPATVTGDARLRLYAHLKDESFRLPGFLDYYRKIGVGEFFIIDNDSQDESRTYLLEQPDVVLFRSSISFLEVHYGAYWINYLMDQFPHDGWSIYVDLDERLVLPGIEDTGLFPILDELDQRGDDLVPGFMIDMIPETLRAGEDYDLDQDPLEACPYLDTDINWHGNVICPYVVYTGGASYRLFDPPPSPNLTKTPLVRSNGDVRFLLTTHWTTPGKVSSMRAGLLHFKFLGGFRKRITGEARAGAQWQFARNFGTYDETLFALNDEASLLGPYSVRYSDSKQLKDLRFISIE